MSQVNIHKKDHFKFLLLVGMVLCIFTSQAQQMLVKGIVLDSITHKPIPYVSIGIIGTGKGTISNEEGSFVFYIDTVKNTQIGVHEVGYTSKIVTINGPKVEVYLSSLSFNLQESIIKSNQAEIWFSKALQKLANNTGNVYEAKAFFRLITKTDDTCTEMIENFYKGLLCNVGIKTWEMEHGRYALSTYAKERMYPHSLDFSQIFRHINLLNYDVTFKINYMPFVFDKRYLKYCWFSIGNNGGGANHMVRIDFEPKTKYKKTIHTHGSIYLNSETFDVYKIIQKWDKWGDAPLISSTDKVTAMRNQTAEFEFTFEPTKNHQMLMNHMRLKLQYEMVDLRKIFKSHLVKTYADLLFYEHKNEPIPLTSDIEEEDYDFDYTMIRRKLYIQRFWDNNPVLAETPYEKKIRQDFDASGSFGNVFNTANDTLDVLADGFLMWQPKRKLSLPDIPLGTNTGKHKDKINFKAGRDTLAAVLGEIYFAFNCYNDTFYHVILPLLDLNYSWINDDDLNSPQLEFMFQLYFDLLEVYKRKLIKEINAFSIPCNNQKQIVTTYKNIVKQFNDEAWKMCHECWGFNNIEPRKAFYWEHEIKRRLKELE